MNPVVDLTPFPVALVESCLYLSETPVVCHYRLNGRIGLTLCVNNQEPHTYTKLLDEWGSLRVLYFFRLAQI